MKDTIMFSGTSHTLGLGLEWELHPEFNSEEYLQKGVFLPVKRTKELDENYWRKYRWSALVCKELGYNEYNVHNVENNALVIGDNMPFMMHLYHRRNEDKIKELIDRTKYIVLEMGYSRWWEQKIHGQPGGENLPNTPKEIENYINSKTADRAVVDAAIKWVLDYDNQRNALWAEAYDKIIKFNKEFPDIQFIIVPWKGQLPDDFYTIFNDIKDWFIKIDGKHGSTVEEYLMENELYVFHKAKAFNGNYYYNERDDHACVEGHRKVADMVIEHIKELENKTI